MGTSPFGTPGFIMLTGSVSQEVRHDRVGWFISALWSVVA